MFAPMAYSVTAALIGALILALTVVPLFCYWWLRRDRMRGENPLMDRLTGWYQPVLERALARPRAVVLTAVALLVGTLALGTRLGSEFLPELDEGSIWLTATLDPSTSLAEAQQQSRRIRELVNTYPQGSTLLATPGGPEAGSDAQGATPLDALEALKPGKAWPAGGDNRPQIANMTPPLEQRIPALASTCSHP